MVSIKELAITEPMVISLINIQEPHEPPDEWSGIRDGWSHWRGYDD